MHRIRRLAVFALWMTLVPSLHAETFQVDGKEIEAAKYAKAYVGSDNVTVEAAPYKITGSMKRGAIIIIRGIESDWDGKAINCEFVESSNGSWEYATYRDGKRALVLRMQKLPKEDRIQLFFPGNRQERYVVPSDGAAQQLNPKTLVQQYLKEAKP